MLSVKELKISKYLHLFVETLFKILSKNFILVSYIQ